MRKRMYRILFRDPFLSEFQQIASPVKLLAMLSDNMLLCKIA